MENPYSGSNLIKGIVFFALFLLALNGFVVRQYGFPWVVAAKDSLVSLQFWGLGALLIGNTIRFYLPLQNRLVFFGGLIFLTTLIWSFSAYFLLQFVNRKYLIYQDFLEDSMVLRIAFTLLLFTALSIFFAFLNLLRNQYHEEQKNIEIQRLAKETELNNLQEKLHPHFLFNSLNSINALVAINPEKARTMVQQLSDFLRSTLKRDNNSRISLEDEVKYLSLYLDIEKVRFGHRLKTQFDIQENSTQVLIPPFILLPLVENAIKFGLYDTLGDVMIHIKIELATNMLSVEITNPFDPQTAINRKGTGFGIKAVNRRMYLLFGRSDLLLTKTENNFFTTQVNIPIQL